MLQKVDYIQSQEVEVGIGQTRLW